MGYKITEEGNFRYIEQGKGPVLFLLHGLFGGLSNWDAVLDYFSPKYNVVIPLLPLFDMPLLKTNVDGLSDHVYGLMKHKGFKQVNLVGNSLGGHVALVFSLDHPEMVKNLVLTGSSGLYESAMGDSYPRRKDYNFIKARTEYTFYKPETASKALVDEVFEIVNNRLKGLKIIQMAKSAIRHNLSKDIVKITCPVCLIWGLDDKITPPHVATEFNELLPNSELHFIGQCGHAPMMEQPAEFNAILDGFLDKVLAPVKAD